MLVSYLKVNRRWILHILPVKQKSDLITNYSQNFWNLDVGLSSWFFVLDNSVGLRWFTKSKNKVLTNSGTWMSGYLRDFLCSIIRSDLACSQNTEIRSRKSGTWMSAYLRDFLCSIKRSERDTSHLFLGTLMSAYLRQFLCSIIRPERGPSLLFKIRYKFLEPGCRVIFVKICAR